MPAIFGRIHPRYLKPGRVHTRHGRGVRPGVLSSSSFKDENLVFDAFTALGLMICFDYGLTGFACTIYYRRHIFKSAKNFFFIGLLPMLGGLSLGVRLRQVGDRPARRGLRHMPARGWGSALRSSSPRSRSSSAPPPGALDPRGTREFFSRKASVVDPSALESARRAGEEADAGIIVGYDGSDGSEAALRAASDLSKRLGSASRWCSDSRQPGRRRGARLLGRPARARRERARHGDRGAKAAGVEVDSLVVEKGPAEALAELGAERNADMIVVGSHGERPIAAALLGSTPHKLVHLRRRPCWWCAASRPMIKEFRAFILRGNLVDLAVAVVIGTAFGAVVTPWWPT